METKTVKVNGVELNVDIIGEGKPILVVGLWKYYPRLFSESIQQQYQWFFADSRLGIPTPEGFDLESFGYDTIADDLEAMRKELGLGKVTILEHSIFGLCALGYARRYPQSVNGAVVIGSPAVTGSAFFDANAASIGNASPERLAISNERLEAFGGQDKLAEVDPDEAVVVSYLNNGPFYWYDMHFDAASLWEGVGINAVAFNSLIGADYDTATAAAVDVPTLVVMGEDDLMVPHTMWTSETKAKLTNLTYHVLDECGHSPPLEQAEKFDGILTQWMSSL